MDQKAQCFSPLLILFMVKYTRFKDGRAAGFSPLLILFMVKLAVILILRVLSFSPLLILFMVKYTYHRARIFQGFCEILGKNIRFFAILMVKELTRD